MELIISSINVVMKIFFLMNILASAVLIFFIKKEKYMVLDFFYFSIFVSALLILIRRPEPALAALITGVFLNVFLFAVIRKKRK